MSSSIEQIRDWVDAGIREPKPTHLIIFCDTFDHSNYPVYVEKDDDIEKIIAKYNMKDMQKVDEVYNYSIDLELQLNERRAYHI